MNIIPLKDDYSHLFAIKEALEKNELVAIHGDRFVDGSKTVMAKLLNKDALFPYGPFFMAMKFKKPVTFVSAVKETDTHYHFYATKPAIYSSSRNKVENESTLHKMLGDYINELERMLTKAPEQWFNYYYFWQRRDEVERDEG